MGLAHRRGLSLSLGTSQSLILTLILSLSRSLTQLEYILLRYCLCTKPVHLTRMLEPDTVAPALQHCEEVVKGELERVVADSGQPLKLSNNKWK